MPHLRIADASDTTRDAFGLIREDLSLWNGTRHSSADVLDYLISRSFGCTPADFVRNRNETRKEFPYFSQKVKDLKGHPLYPNFTEFRNNRFKLAQALTEKEDAENGIHRENPFAIYECPQPAPQPSTVRAQSNQLAQDEKARESVNDPLTNNQSRPVQLTTENEIPTSSSVKFESRGNVCVSCGQPCDDVAMTGHDCLSNRMDRKRKRDSGARDSWRNSPYTSESLQQYEEKSQAEEENRRLLSALSEDPPEGVLSKSPRMPPEPQFQRFSMTTLLQNKIKRALQNNSVLYDRLYQLTSEIVKKWGVAPSKRVLSELFREHAERFVKENTFYECCIDVHKLVCMEVIREVS